MKNKNNITGIVAAILMFGLFISPVGAKDKNDSDKSMIQKMDYDSFLNLAKERRSIRRFKPDPVPDEYIKKMVEAARWAPSGFNSQLWEFVVVRDPKIKDRVSDIIMKAFGKEFGEMMRKSGPPGGVDKPPLGQMPPMGFTKAPAFIILLGDSRVRKYCPFPIMHTDDQKWFRTYQSSLAIAYQYMALSATSLGLGSQWVSSIHLSSVPEQIREVIGIPEEMIFFDMFAVGYPDMKPGPKKMRPLEEMIHYDACGTDDFRTEERIKAYFGVK